MKSSPVTGKERDSTSPSTAQPHPDALLNSKLVLLVVSLAPAPSKMSMKGQSRGARPQELSAVAMSPLNINELLPADDVHPDDADDGRSDIQPFEDALLLSA